MIANFLCSCHFHATKWVFTLGSLFYFYFYSKIVLTNIHFNFLDCANSEPCRSISRETLGLGVAFVFGRTTTATSDSRDGYNGLSAQLFVLGDNEDKVFTVEISKHKNLKKLIKEEKPEAEFPLRVNQVQRLSSLPRINLTPSHDHEPKQWSRNRQLFLEALR